MKPPIKYTDQSQRDCVLQPRVAEPREATLVSNEKSSSTLKRLCQSADEIFPTRGNSIPFQRFNPFNAFNDSPHSLAPIRLISVSSPFCVLRRISLLTALFLLPALHAQTFSVQNQSFNSAASSTNSQYSVSGTVGQALTSDSSGSGFKISSGFWNTVSRSGPSIASPIPDLSAVVGQVPTTFSVHPYFSDSDDSDTMMSYAVVSNTRPSVASASAINSHDGLLTLTFGETGATEITVCATNSRGQSVTDTFSVSVLSPFVFHTEDLFEDSELVTWGIKLSEPSDPTGTSLTVTAVPSDTSLVPGSDGVFTLTHPGGGNDWLLHLQPASEMNGNLAIAIVVTGPTGELQRYNSAIRIFSVNDPPTVTILGDQSAIADNVPRTISNFATVTSVGPPNESSQSVSFLMTTDNTTLFAAQPSISPTGDLSYTPKSGANGTALVTVVTRDNGGTSSGGINSTTNSFTISITQPNRVPAFTAGPTTTTIIEDNSTAALSITLADPDDLTGTSLTLTATSADTNVIPVNGIVFSGAGNNRSVRVTPAPNQFANVIITLTVTDPQGASALRSFTVRVLSANDPPSFVAGDDFLVQTNSGTHMTTWATSLSTGPANESGQSLTFTVVNNNTALFSSTGQPRLSALGVLSFTVAPNKIGTATVTATLKDNGGTANGGQNTSAAQTFTISVSHLVYVRADGNDSNTGSVDSPSGAKRTVQAAINTVTAGGYVFVGPGTFTGPVVVNKPVNLLGAQAGVDARNRTGAESILALASGTVTLSLQSTNIVVDGFSVLNPNSVSGVIGVDTSSASSGYQLWNNRISGNSVGIRLGSTFSFAQPTVVSQNWISANNQSGADAGHGILISTALTNAVVRDTEISSHAAAGIEFNHNDVRVDLERLQITSNQEGIRYGAMANLACVTIRNSAIADNAPFGINQIGNGFIDAAHNWWGSDTGPAAASNPNGEGSLVFGNAIISPFLTTSPF